MISLTEDMLQEITKKIVDTVNPIKIILFGSYARGTAGQNSDLDFLIIEEQPFGFGRSRRAETSKLWRSLANIEIPKDVLVFSKDEIEYWKESKNHVISYALREGKVIYERT